MPFDIHIVWFDIIHCVVVSNSMKLYLKIAGKTRIKPKPPRLNEGHATTIHKQYKMSDCGTHEITNEDHKQFVEMFLRFTDAISEKTPAHAELTEAYSKVLRAVVKAGPHREQVAKVKSSIDAVMKNDAHGCDEHGCDSQIALKNLLEFVGAEKEWANAPVRRTQREAVIEGLRGARFPEDVFEDKTEFGARATINALGTMMLWGVVGALLDEKSSVETVLAHAKSVAVHAVFGRPLKWHNSCNKAVVLVALAEKWSTVESPGRVVICKFLNDLVGDDILAFDGITADQLGNR